MTTKKKKKKFIKVMSPKFRVSFPNVFVPKAIKEGDKLKYSIAMLFGPEAQASPEFKAMRAALKEAAIEEYGDLKKLPAQFRKNPFRKGSEKDFEGYDDDVLFCNASSTLKPGLIDNEKIEIINPEDFYAGCYARATLSVFTYDYMGNTGVSFGICNIQKLADGAAFSGRTKAEDDFEIVEDEDGFGDESDSKEYAMEDDDF